MLGRPVFFCVRTSWNKLLGEQAESVGVRGPATLHPDEQPLTRWQMPDNLSFLRRQDQTLISHCSFVITVYYQGCLHKDTKCPIFYMAPYSKLTKLDAALVKSISLVGLCGIICLNQGVFNKLYFE